MKKIALLLSVLLMAGLAAGCGGGGAQSSGANYVDVIRAARDAEQNQVFFILADPETRDGASSMASSAVQDESGELFEQPDPDTVEQQQRDFIFNEATGLSDEPMARYAISLGFSITQAYGIAIVLPKEGEAQAVTDMLNGYVLSQQKAQENYLQDQYQIAKSAIVRTTASGEVIMVMCKDSATVAEAIEAGLK